MNKLLEELSVKYGVDDNLNESKLGKIAVFASLMMGFTSLVFGIHPTKDQKEEQIETFEEWLEMCNNPSVEKIFAKEKLTDEDIEDICEIYYKGNRKDFLKWLKKCDEIDREIKAHRDDIEDENTHYVDATVYNALKAQTNSQPNITASNKRIKNVHKAGDLRWIAVSRDLAEKIPFGSKVEVSGITGPDADYYNGIWQVEDLMNKRFDRKIDFLVDSNVKLGSWKDIKIRVID